MRKILLTIVLFSAFVIPVSAMEFSAPTVPDVGEKYMPEDTESFGEGVWYIFKSAVSAVQPELAQSGKICLSLIAVCLLISVLKLVSSRTEIVYELVAVVVIGTLLFNTSNTLIRLSAESAKELSDYGKLLLPVMTGAMAAQGGVTTSAALYAGTVLFNSVLSSVISNLLVPMVYVYLCLSMAARATQDDMVVKLQSFLKWCCTWCIKTVLYIFTGYMTISGVVSGTADASAVKAAKLTISGVVPVVGGIIADASEAVLIGAGVMKSTAGIYGLLAILAIWIGPFLQIGIQYILLKLTSGACASFGGKQSAGFIEDISSAMGLLLAMVSSICLLHLISTVCFMRGIA